LASQFITDKVANVDSDEVAAIMSVEMRLVAATKSKLNVATAWADFRKGDYASAKTILDQLGVSEVRYTTLPEDRSAGFGVPRTVTVYSLAGKKLYSGPVNGMSALAPRPSQSAIACYKYDNGAVSIGKIFLGR
jgi:hypothetical protein